MTEGPEISLAGRDAVLRSLAGGRVASRIPRSETKGFLQVGFFFPSSVFHHSMLYLTLLKEALMRISLISWGLTGTQTTLHLIPPSPPLGQQEAPNGTAEHQRPTRLHACVSRSRWIKPLPIRWSSLLQKQRNPTPKKARVSVGLLHVGWADCPWAEAAVCTGELARLTRWA